MRFEWARALVVSLTILTIGTVITLAAMQVDGPPPSIETADQLFQQGNFQEAATVYRDIIRLEDAPSEQVLEAMRKLAECRQRLGLDVELDSDLQLAVTVHQGDFMVLDEAARQILAANHIGTVADQVFTRGYGRGYGGRGGVAGTQVNVLDQDRLQAMRWRTEALRLAKEQDASASSLAQIHLGLARGLLTGREDRQAWALQHLTDLSQVPDYLDLDGPLQLSARYAPVDDDSEPVLHGRPDSWEDALSDGQRLRWALAQAELDESIRWGARLVWADFLHSQFSVDTLQQEMWLRRADSGEQEETGVWAIHTLDDNETIAKLASGVERFELSDEFNPVYQYKQIAASDDDTNSRAAWQLVNIYLNRRQYPQAASRIENYLERFDDDARQSKRALLDNIRQPRLEFDPSTPFAAGEQTTVSFVFRNAEQVTFTAHRVDVEKLLADTKSFYRSADQSLGDRFGGIPGKHPPQLSSPSSLFNDDSARKYLAEQAARWEQAVEPRDNHWDRRVEIETPLTEPGLYLVEAVAGDLHKSRCLLAIHDTAIVKKTVEGKTLYHVADARSGQPIAGANVELFGYGYERTADGRRNRIVTDNFAALSDEQGQVLVELRQEYQYFAVARTDTGRRALLDFDRIWQRAIEDDVHRAFKAYGVSDRPLYRPGELVKAKFWLANVTYGDLEPPPVADQQVRVTLLDPQGLKVAEQQVQTDQFGGCEFETTLDSTAMLGRYQFYVAVGQQPARRIRSREGRPSTDMQDRGIATSLAIRVEEYRKPEFEVSIHGPEKPVALGETIRVRLEAKYYFGAPVTDADVIVRVERSEYTDHYYPVAPFDWCYEPGYWWFAEDYPWYPGWSSWRGCVAPRPNGIPRWGFEPPELVLEKEVRLDASGNAEIEIDTALAKSLFGESDHRYTMNVEVRDQSRRTITAQGEIIAARDPFRIYTWTTRGYYRVGDKITAEFHARRLDGESVTGSGTIDLLRITYGPDLQPVEEAVASFPAATDENGRCTQVMSADRAGQYRVRLRLRDEAGHEVEGAYVFTVRGEGATGDDFRYNALELIPDKQHYAPGESVQLQIASEKADALVALFVKPANGGYPLPQWIQLEDKAAIVDISVEHVDQPNFFVEAYTIFDGEFHREVREIFVPPAERVLDVALNTDKQEYLPGETAELSVQVADPEGRPVEGSVVLAVYDRSLEQIASDVLPGDIRKYFWSWRRHHYPQGPANLEIVLHPIRVEGQPGLMPLGIFGHSLADDLDQLPLEAGKSIGRGGELGNRMRQFGGASSWVGFDAAPMSLGADMAMAEGAEPAAASTGRAAPAADQVERPQVRQNFADSALWLANLTTDRNGKGNAKLTMPENLTGWQVRSWAVASNTRVGSASAQAVTRKPLLVRLITPRFLVERDEVVISAIVHNDLPETRQVRVALEIDGETSLELLDSSPSEQTVEIASHQQTRVDWRCKAIAAGEVKLRALAITHDASDGMQLELPVHVHGMLKMDAFAGAIRPEQNVANISIRVPEQRRVEQSRLVVRMSPSLAAAMIDALPYLAEYPYGCTEQTLNRFLPTLMTNRFLNSLQLDLQAIKQQRNNLNTQELGPPDQRNAQWQRFDSSAVFDNATVEQMVQAGLKQLADMQNADGGWGWFYGPQEVSSAHTTAVVVRGLLMAQQAGAAVVPDVLARGLAWLENHQASELAKLQGDPAQGRLYKAHVDNSDALVFHVLVLGDHQDEEMQRRLYEGREHLSNYGKVLFALATQQLGNAQQTAMLQRNLEQFLVVDPDNETAFLRNDSSWWYWYGSEIETNAMYLKLLTISEPEGATASRLVKFLLNNRKHATYWNSTRDTALCVEAFADYLAATDELNRTQTAEVWLSDRRLGSVEFTPQNLFSVNNSIEISGAALPAGEHSLEIRRSGAGNMYWNAYISNFTLEDDIDSAGLEVRVERRYYRLQAANDDLLLPDAQAGIVEKQRSSQRRIPLSDLDALPPGTLVEVELLIESKNDYEYLLIEDPKPASLETVETQSGYFFNAGLSIFRELRDTKVGLCIRWLPKGNYSIRYQLRSEAPGRFTAMPTVIQGMYAPELRGNSTDFDLQVVED